MSSKSPKLMVLDKTMFTGSRVEEPLSRTRLRTQTSQETARKTLASSETRSESRRRTLLWPKLHRAREIVAQVFQPLRRRILRPMFPSLLLQLKVMVLRHLAKNHTTMQALTTKKSIVEILAKLRTASSDAIQERIWLHLARM